MTRTERQQRARAIARSIQTIGPGATARLLQVVKRTDPNELPLRESRCQQMTTTRKPTLQEVSDQLGEAFHSALRKASDHPAAWEAWKAINRMPDEEWAAILIWVRQGTGLPPRSND